MTVHPLVHLQYNNAVHTGFSTLKEYTYSLQIFDNNPKMYSPATSHPQAIATQGREINSADFIHTSERSRHSYGHS